MSVSVGVVALDLLYIVLGGGLLYFGAEWLVAGASRLAAALGTPPLLIGLTVVSYGTSAPELAVSLTAALEGQSAVALGNVIGSNIANIGLVLGLTALISPPLVPPGLWRKELLWLSLATLALPAMLWDGLLSRLEAAAYALGAVAFTYASVVSARRARREQREAAELREAERKAGALEIAIEEAVLTNTSKNAGMVLVGLFLLPLGGKLFVDSSVDVARVLGISEATIGLTLVAFGTSMPELAASVVSAWRGHSDLAIGNVLGSNLFNLLLILGATGVVHPVTGSTAEQALELWALGAFTVVSALSLSKVRRMSRPEGGLYVAGYVAFLVALVALR